MMQQDKLQQRLINIEKALGGDGKLPPNYDNIDKLEWHLCKIEELILQGGGGGTEVIANPTLIGDEDALSGIQVGEIKYKVITSGEVDTKIENAITDSLNEEY